MHPSPHPHPHPTPTQIHIPPPQVIDLAMNDNKAQLFKMLEKVKCLDRLKSEDKDLVGECFAQLRFFLLVWLSYCCCHPMSSGFRV